MAYLLESFSSNLVLASSHEPLIWTQGLEEKITTMLRVKNISKYLYTFEKVGISWLVWQNIDQMQEKLPLAMFICQFF